jgi:thiol-disulfide isomerase/thioredoxin
MWCLVALLPLSPQALAQQALAIGDLLPSIDLRGLNGTSRNLSEFRGTPLVINIWASWCKPCRAEMKSLERLAWMEGFARFNVIGVSTDDRVEKARSLLRSTNATLLHFIDRGREMESLLGADRIPLTVFIDAEGRLLRKHYGAKQWDAPENRIYFPDSFFSH